MKLTSQSKPIVIIGWLGTIMLMIAYALNSLGFLESTGLVYAGMNLVAAILLGLRVFADKNWSNVFLEIFWIIVALISIIRYLFF